MKSIDKNTQNAEKLFLAFNELDDELFAGLGEDKIPSGKAPRKSARIQRVLSAAAAVLALAVGAAALIRILPFFKGANAAGGGVQGKSEDGSSLFMRYEGPVFPLLLRPDAETGTGAENITSERLLCYDFFGAADERDTKSIRSVLLHDHFALKNAGAEKTLKLLYPFVSTVEDLYYSVPEIRQNGEIVPSKLCYGDFTGSFVPAAGSDAADETLNIKQSLSWENYQTLAGDHAYLERAFAETKDISHIPVTVYSFTDSYYPESAEDENPTLVAEVEREPGKSKILSFGFNGYAKSDDDDKKEYYQYSIPKKGYNDYGEDHHYLIILGEDTPELTIETQKIGGWEAYENPSSGERDNLPGAGAAVEREEMNLSQALDLALPFFYEHYKSNHASGISSMEQRQSKDFTPVQEPISYEDFKNLYIRDLYENGPLSQAPVMRYSDGSLESLDTLKTQRLLFAAFDIRLEEGEKTELSITSYKEGSYDFYCKTAEQKIYGYDLLTTVESALPTETFEAEIIDHGCVELRHQNFGFDLENGIRKVQLNEEIPHYYMEVSLKND